ncbi:HXXEE domain-containing protein [Paenibacillus sp. IHBB 10380]|uniref:HXXEE domain-containing protein n=1 Tax=Paenibacillus sp. IHBB 10380 TaxID=1566358 RepID=UPI0005CFACBA|nr:HXXEE domain-containing protein [Paenibacillus sp. IHBB 10380]AJS61250.1 membrane protein [Paenibacillus sp. IHBB 10380]
MHILRRHWQDLGLLLAAVVSVYILSNWDYIAEIRVVLWLSFVSILIHQFEEYRWPGTFGGLFNVIIFKSPHPDHYPLNSHSAMVINLLIAYLFYLLPVLFPDVIWLGLAPILMGFFQIIWHGVFANLKARSIYNPGLFAALFLHLPIGIWYIHYITSHNLVSLSGWIMGTVYFVIAVYLLIIQGNMWMKNPQSPYSFSKKQLGDY